MHMLIAVALLAGPAANIASSAPEIDHKDPAEIRCKSVRELSSRVPKRVCKTNAAWKEEEQATRAAMEDTTRRRQCSGSSVC